MGLKIDKPIYWFGICYRCPFINWFMIKTEIGFIVLELDNCYCNSLLSFLLPHFWLSPLSLSFLWLVIPIFLDKIWPYAYMILVLPNATVDLNY